jgi:hypothetical protein
MTPTYFRVQTKICNGGNGPAVDVRIFETIECTHCEFLSASSFVADLDCLPALVIALTRVLMKAAGEGCIDDEVQGGQS